MKKNRSPYYIISLLLCVMVFSTMITVAYAETADTDPTKSMVADRLVIELGQQWAGAEFELTTDVGKYPGTIVVDEFGKLEMDIGGSTLYTLKSLGTFATPTQPVSIADDNGVSAAADTEETAVPSIEATPNASPALSGATDIAPDAAGDADAEASEPEGVPTLHLVLFIGGAVVCIGALIAMRFFKKRKERSDSDDDDEY